MQLQTAPDNSATPEDLIELERVRMLFHHLPTSVTGTVFGATLLTLVMWGVVPNDWLIAWLVATWLNQGVRLKLYVDFRRQGLDPRHLREATNVWMFGAGTSGLLWAVANVLFFVSDAPLYQAMLYTSTFAIVSVAVPLVASHLPSLYVFVIPVMVASIGRNLWEADQAHALLAGISLATMLGVLSVGIRYNRLLSASYRARFDNEMLAARLSQKNIELEAARNVAEQASLAKSRFLAAASHDLRQPLHALTLFSGALSKESDPQRVAVLTQHIETSVSALETLFNSLLDISKLDAGVIKPNITDFGAQELLERVENDFDALASEKRLHLRVRATDAVLRTDAVLLERMLRNLVANAVRYTDSGCILVACRRRGKHWRIEVRDSGIGIPDDQHRRVFEEYYQVGNPERDRDKGLGLGLAIVARLSRLLNCPVELRSKPGIGTTFAITVPAGMVRRRGQSTVSLDNGLFDGLRVLIIDDEAGVREGMDAILHTWGCDTVAAESLLDAVSAMHAREWKPEFVISDYRLKDNQDGIGVLNWLREHYGNDLPCLLVTGDIEANLLKSVRESGYPLVHKPLSPAKLRAVISSLSKRVEEPA